MAWADWTAPFEEFEMTVGELIDAGDSVVAEIRQRGRLKDGGDLVEERFWFVCSFFEGSWVQWDMLASKRQALTGVRRRDAAPDPPADGRNGGSGA